MRSHFLASFLTVHEHIGSRSYENLTSQSYVFLYIRAISIF